MTLEGQEIRRGADGTISGKRYYQLGGTVVAMRDGDGTAEGTVWWILANHQGSIMTMVQRGTTTVTRQRYLPHGAPRGTATIPTDRGFLGKTEDDSTGLVHLGARYYDPRIARFISVDPLL